MPNTAVRARTTTTMSLLDYPGTLVNPGEWGRLMVDDRWGSR